MPECPGCGAAVDDTAAFCPSCGTDMESRDTSMNTGSDDNDDQAFFIGAAVTSVCVIVAPYFLFLVAMPESIAGLLGTSIQDSLPEGGRNNTYVSGAFLIIRWFGNFLWLLFILGVVLALFLVF